MIDHTDTFKTMGFCPTCERYTAHVCAKCQPADPRDAEIARLRSLLKTIQHHANGRSLEEHDNYNRLVDIDQWIHAALKLSEPGA